MDCTSSTSVGPTESDRSIIAAFLRRNEPHAMYMLQALSESFDLVEKAGNWALVWGNGPAEEQSVAACGGSLPDRSLIACGYRLEAANDLHFIHICSEASDVLIQACFRRLYIPSVKGVCGPSPLLRNALTDSFLSGSTGGRPLVFEQVEDAFILDTIETEALANVLTKAADFTVRLAETSDLGELASLEQAYQKEENAQDFDVEQAMGSVKDFADKGRLFVGGYLDGIVAMARFHVSLDDAVLVNDVFVSSAHRGKGLGKAIVAGALQKWKQKHDSITGSSKRAILHVGQTNIVARRTYESLGFRQSPQKEAMHCVTLG